MFPPAAQREAALVASAGVNIPPPGQSYKSGLNRVSLPTAEKYFSLNSISFKITTVQSWNWKTMHVPPNIMIRFYVCVETLNKEAREKLFVLNTRVV